MTKSKHKQSVVTHRVSGEGTLLSLFDSMNVIRLRDAIAAGIHPEVLRRLRSRGQIERIARGVYVKAGKGPSQYQSLIEVQIKSPRSVACLLTALRYHEVGTQSPREVWIALPPGARAPQLMHPRLRVFRFSGEAYASGIEILKVGGNELRVYSVAKTVADCFKFRRKIGTNIAVEALRDALRDKKCTVDEVWRFAKVCRVSRIMQPYLEVVV